MVFNNATFSDFIDPLTKNNVFWLILAFFTILGGIAAVGYFIDTWQQRKKSDIISKLASDIDEIKKSQQALEIHRKIGYKQGEARQLGNIGLIYRDRGEYDEALKYHQQALEIAREIEYKLGEANQLGNIGLIYSARGETNEALKYLQKALHVFESIGAKTFINQTKNIICQSRHI